MNAFEDLVISVECKIVDKVTLICEFCLHHLPCRELSSLAGFSLFTRVGDTLRFFQRMNFVEMMLDLPSESLGMLVGTDVNRWDKRLHAL